MTFSIEELQIDVDILQSETWLSAVDFCEKYECSEIRPSLYVNLTIHKMKIDVKGLYSYLKSKVVTV